MSLRQGHAAGGWGAFGVWALLPLALMGSMFGACATVRVPPPPPATQAVAKRPRVLTLEMEHGVRHVEWTAVRLVEEGGEAGQPEVLVTEPLPCAIPRRSIPDGVSPLRPAPEATTATERH